MDYFDGVAAKLVALAPNQKLIGRVRLQKVAYLLDALGLKTGLSFSYYHYGPFSRDLDQGTDDARSLGWISEVKESRVGDGATYSVFSLEPKAENAPDLDLGEMGEARARELVEKFAGVSATILELAATAHWLSEVEKVANWRDEIVLRKGIKTQSGRLDQAIFLLGECGLPPGVAV
jgi:uncharacterized protein